MRKFGKFVDYCAHSPIAHFWRNTYTDHAAPIKWVMRHFVTCLCDYCICTRILRIMCTKHSSVFIHLSFENDILIETSVAFYALNIFANTCKKISFFLVL